MLFTAQTLPAPAQPVPVARRLDIPSMAIAWAGELATTDLLIQAIDAMTRALIPPLLF